VGEPRVAAGGGRIVGVGQSETEAAVHESGDYTGQRGHGVA
jgi:hypothetical protein